MAAAGSPDAVAGHRRAHAGRRWLLSRRGRLGLGSIALCPALLAAAAPFDVAGFRQGLAAVGTRPSDAMALRAAAAPTPAFRLGAATGAWRNATAAIAYDASHTTGDGGDAEALAEDCTDERLAFTAMEAARRALSRTPEEVAGAAGFDAAEIRARTAAPPRQCR